MLYHAESTWKFNRITVNFQNTSCLRGAQVVCCSSTRRTGARRHGQGAAEASEGVAETGQGGMETGDQDTKADDGCSPHITMSTRTKPSDRSTATCRGHLLLRLFVGASRLCRLLLLLLLLLTMFLDDFLILRQDVSLVGLHLSL